MRLALAAALLVVLLCSQGCLSFFFYRESPNSYASSRKTVSLITGIVGGALVNAGIACIGAGIYMKANPPDKEPGEIYEGEWTTGDSMIWGGSLLLGLGLAPSIISLIYGRKHYYEVQRCRREEGYREYDPLRGRRSARGIGPAPHEPSGQSIVGLPNLKHIDPRKLPIQKVNWYWIREE